MASDREQLLESIDRRREEFIGFLRGFIRARSPNPPGDTLEAAAFIREFLSRQGLEHRVIAPNETMPNIVASFEGGEARPPSRPQRPYRRLPGRATATAGRTTRGAASSSTASSTGAAPPT